MKHRAAEPLRSAMAACDELITRVGDVELDVYLQDRDLQLITERLVIAVGEGVSKAAGIDESVLVELPEARRAIGARNRVAHGYEDIRNDIVWDIAVSNIPRLRNALADMLGDASIPTDGHSGGQGSSP